MKTSATRRPSLVDRDDRRVLKDVHNHAHQILCFATLSLQTLVTLLDRQAVAVAGEQLYEKDVTLLEGLATLARTIEEHAEAIEAIGCD
jgi:hypothetical protein